MAKIPRTGGTGGAWIKKDTLKNGDQIRLVSEAEMMESTQGGQQLVAKCRLKGSSEAVNVAINNASRNALIDAFGDDSKNWINQTLTVETEKVLIAGKRGTALYLIPAGFAVTTDAEGYVVISGPKTGTPVVAGADTSEPVIQVGDEDTRNVPAAAYDNEENW